MLSRRGFQLGGTALHVAASKGYFEVARLLVAMGADINLAKQVRQYSKGASL